MTLTFNDLDDGYCKNGLFPRSLNVKVIIMAHNRTPCYRLQSSRKWAASIAGPESSPALQSAESQLRALLDRSGNEGGFISKVVKRQSHYHGS
jgi:hypothetical protein